MEIVLAVLLLFGGFVLGSVESEMRDDELQSSVAPPNVADEAGLYAVTQAVERRNSIPCHSDGPVIYRDLTLPYSSQTGDCTVKGLDE